MAAVVIAAFHPAYDSFWEQWGSAIADGLVATGVAIEIKFGQMAGARQDELKRRTDEKLGNANSELARVKAQLAPRSLTQAQQLAIAEKLKSLKGHRVYIAVSPDLPETQMFARIIGAALHMAEIDFVFPTMATRGPMNGVVVGFNNNPGSKDAALTIAEAFLDAGVLAIPLPGESGNNETWPSYVLITVGMKPDQDDAERVMVEIPKMIAQWRGQ